MRYLFVSRVLSYFLMATLVILILIEFMEHVAYMILVFILE